MIASSFKRGRCRPGRLGTFILACTLVAAGVSSAGAIEFPGPKPGKATASLDRRSLRLQNDVIAASWNLAPSRFELVEVVDRISSTSVCGRSAEVFSVRLAGGRLLRASELGPAGEPTLERLQPEADSLRLAQRCAGWRATVPLVDGDGRIRVRWCALIRDRSNYIRQEVTLRSGEGEIPVEGLTLLDVSAPKARTLGAVDGSPVVARNLFFACEHPMAQNRVKSGRVVCGLPRYAAVRPAEPLLGSSVIGVVPEGQLRRAFSYYVQRERARPYCPFVYYISWFDIAWPDRKMDQQQCLDAIEGFGRQLNERRGVELDAFVFDDGWDDNRTLWRFHRGFPHGFTPLASAAAKYNAVLGTWISPWGGYGKAKAQRLEYGMTQGFEQNRHGFSLAGPKYYARFREVCAEMIRKYGVKYLKFDGVGPGNVATGAGEEYGPDIEALLRLISDLRRLRADLFVNTTVGTWPSPYWLWYSDSIWRSGSDVGFSGQGSTRQQWLTYRDMIAYRQRVCPAPLYPLNSLKFQSVICAKLGLATKLSNEPKDLLDDIRMAAGSGTQLQEFFLTAKMIPADVWDAAAEAIDWLRRNADVLVDSHWVGGDPGKGQVYGFASWSPRAGILVMRNPCDKAAQFRVDVERAFELPRAATRRYLLQSPWKHSAKRPQCTLQAGKPHTFELAPFEVRVLEAVPVE